MEEKACAIVMRTSTTDGAQVLMFRHPLAGVQFVKGGLQRGETPKQAAKRELFEESGLKAQDAKAIGSIEFEALNQRWHIFQCTISDAPDAWTHQTRDDDGQAFRFFWHPIATPLPPDTGATYCHVFQTLNDANALRD